MTTKKDLSDVLREGMSDNVPKPPARRRPSPAAKIEENAELQSLKSELEKEREKAEQLQKQIQAEQEERIKFLQQQIQSQNEEIKELTDSLQEQQEQVKTLQEKKQFIVPVGTHPRYDHLVILPATSTELTDEQIGWFD
jgi:TolA-binding protein